MKRCDELAATARDQRGVTMIEVLVAMVIVAIGLLGLAGMQVRGLSIQKDAHGRAIATQLALDMADRMRANRDPATRAVPNQYSFVAPWSVPQTPPAIGTNCLSAKAPCTIGQQALYDIADWLGRVNAALPGGWAYVQPVGAGEPAWDITLIWQETGFRARTNPALGAQAVALASSCAGVVPYANALPFDVECMQIRVRP